MVVSFVLIFFFGEKRWLKIRKKMTPERNADHTDSDTDLFAVLDHCCRWVPATTGNKR